MREIVVTDNAPRESGRFLPGFSYSPETQIKRGERLSPATEIKAGQRLSPSTEFKPGQSAHNKLAIGSVRIRRETHTGLYRAWVKVDEPNVWKKRAVLVWESHYGSLPRGWVVHHDDRNSLNDDISNLIGMTRRAHVEEHREELNDARNNC